MTQEIPAAPSYPLADHRPSRTAFEQLLTADPAARILLLHGPEPDSGKTRLLDHCFARVSPTVATVRIDMKVMAHPADELLASLRLPPLAPLLPTLAAERLARASPLIQIGDIRQYGANSLAIDAKVDPEDARKSLIDAFFADAVDLRLPLLIAIDHYERAPAAVKDWVAGPFLARVARVKAVRVIIAGREVPALSGLWGGCCGPVQKLEPVTQPGEWKALIEEMGRRIETKDPDGTLAEVCRALGKNTSMLMVWIENALPRESVPG